MDMVELFKRQSVSHMDLPFLYLLVDKDHMVQLDITAVDQVVLNLAVEEAVPLILGRLLIHPLIACW